MGILSELASGGIELFFALQETPDAYWVSLGGRRSSLIADGYFDNLI
ncbi:MAG: hypothetical protein ACE5QW_01305 [Thermoplasmata archaeon]